MAEDNRLEAENSRLRQLLAQAGVDAAKSDLARQLQDHMMEELSHRVKNMLTIVQAVATLSLNSAASLEEARAAIESRLSALGKVHDQILRNNWAGASLDTLLTAAVAPFGPDRFIVESPRITVSAAAALPVAMALNELCTNAVKYGALSQEGGRVHLKADVDDDTQAIRITWTETGGPLVQTPTRRSFGTRLIENSLLGSFEGKVALQFQPSGVVCEMRIPLAKLQTETSG